MKNQIINELFDISAQNYKIRKLSEIQYMYRFKEKYLQYIIWKIQKLILIIKDPLEMKL